MQNINYPMGKEVTEQEHNETEITDDAPENEWAPLYETIIDPIRDEVLATFFHIGDYTHSVPDCADPVFSPDQMSKIQIYNTHYMLVNTTDQYCHKQYNFVEMANSDKKKGAVLVNIDAYNFWVGIIFENEKRGTVGDSFYKAVMNGIRWMESFEQE